MKSSVVSIAEPFGQASAAAPALEVAAAGFSPEARSLDHALQRTRAFAEPLIAHEMLDTGENTLAHADAVAAILRSIGGSEAMQAASYLVYACDHLNRPQEVIEKAFGESYATLAVETTKLVKIQRLSRAAAGGPHVSPGASSISPGGASQTENIRKMLLAFSRDLRVVMLRLASRLQTLRHYAATKQRAPRAVAAESLQVFAPLANRLGIWQIKWEMEDLAFRFLEPDTYKTIAKQLDAKRAERETAMAQLRAQLEHDLQAAGVQAHVQARPKHIYSIVKKMRGKNLGFDQVLDVRAMRVIVPSVADCYAALSLVHERFTPMAGEFDDYVAKPKANGYQSLHTVVLAGAAGQLQSAVNSPVEIQIRTQYMHDHAEIGVAAHWAYKEAGTKGYAGVSAAGAYDAKIAVLRQLLAWQSDVSAPGEAAGVEKADLNRSVTNSQLLDDRIYVLTPDAAIVDLPVGATPIDFAYAVHTDVGDRTVAAKVNGEQVPLRTEVKNGDVIEVVTAPVSNPNPAWLGFVRTARARSKIRHHLKTMALDESESLGDKLVSQALRAEGIEHLPADDEKYHTLWDKLLRFSGNKTRAELLVDIGLGKRIATIVAKRIVSLLAELGEKPNALLMSTERFTAHESISQGAIVLDGSESATVQYAPCCRPLPGDAIVGYLGRGEGLLVHTAQCAIAKKLLLKDHERFITVEWADEPVRAFESNVVVTVQSGKGVLAKVAAAMASAEADITQVDLGRDSEVGAPTADLRFVINLRDTAHLDAVLRTVSRTPRVLKAWRALSG